MSDRPGRVWRVSSPYRFAGRLRHGGRVHMLWWHYGDKTSLPLSVWRPLCWLVARRHTEHYGSCVICGKPMTPARNDR